MAEGLSAYLRAARDIPFQWGKFDCCTFAADWVRQCTGVDLMQDVRGTYSTSEGAVGILNEHGGLLKIFDNRMTRSDDPIAGVLFIPDQHPACGIPTGKKWAILTPEGLQIVNARAIGAQAIGFR